MSQVLSEQQMIDFGRDGYLHMPAAVSVEACRAAMQAINHNLGQGMDPSQMTKFRAQSYCPQLQPEPVITDLFNESKAFAAAEQMIGGGKVQKAGGGQIALRFPAAPGGEPKGFGGHIDGIGSGSNGIPVGEFRRGFTMLCVVLLDDVLEQHCGNFTVWPGSHVLIEQVLKSSGPASLSKGTPKTDPGPPMMTTGQQGDVIFVHYLTLHSVAPHIGPRIRYAAIFRVRHVDVATNGEAAYTDKWLEFEPIRAALGESAAPQR